MIDLNVPKVLTSFSAGAVDLKGIDTEEEGIIDPSSSLAAVPREPDGVAWIGTVRQFQGKGRLQFSFGFISRAVLIFPLHRNTLPRRTKVTGMEGLVDFLFSTHMAMLFTIVKTFWIYWRFKSVRCDSDHPILTRQTI